jgi:hypothetical protein
MKVGFSDSFFESLKRLNRYEAWYNRLWRAITSDLWEFFRNVWRFRKELWDHRWWDYGFSLSMFRRSLIIMEEGMHDGIEVIESRAKKIEKMQRAVEILGRLREGSYVEMAEAELGKIIRREWEFKPLEEDPELFEIVDRETPEENEHNRKIFARANEIEEAEWEELWQIMKGQDYKQFDKEKDWNEQFDGTGIRGWWD